MEQAINTSAHTLRGVVDRTADTAAARTTQHASETIERTASREPINSVWRTGLMAGAAGAIALSLACAALDRKHTALFVGQWVPTLLLLALWGQLVKTEYAALSTSDAS